MSSASPLRGEGGDARKISSCMRRESSREGRAHEKQSLLGEGRRCVVEGSFDKLRLRDFGASG